ncbi:UNVERIFIED_CONTAM: hypothetical protein NCL1_30708 [Trichonephila clavipes]
MLYYHTDHLGTPRELTDRSGHIAWAATYKAWGNTTKIEHPPRLVASADGNTLSQHWAEQAEPVEQNLRFQGQYFDGEPDCTTTASGITIRIVGGLSARIRLGCWVGSITTSTRRARWGGLIRWA